MSQEPMEVLFILVCILLIHNIYKIYINVFELGNQCGLFLTVLTFREVTVLSILGRS